MRKPLLNKFFAPLLIGIGIIQLANHNWWGVNHDWWGVLAFSIGVAWISALFYGC